MSDKHDEISLKEAAELVRGHILRRAFEIDDELLMNGEVKIDHRSEAEAVLDTMLAASRAGKVVKG